MHHSHKEGFFGLFGDIYIVNKNKVKTADTSKSVILNQTLNSKAVEEVLVSKEPLSGIYKKYRGVRVLGTALFVPEANRVIIAEKNIKEAFAPLARIKHIFLLSEPGVFFLVLLFGFIISGKINTIKKSDSRD